MGASGRVSNKWHFKVSWARCGLPGSAAPGTSFQLHQAEFSHLRWVWGYRIPLPSLNSGPVGTGLGLVPIVFLAWRPGLFYVPHGAGGGGGREVNLGSAGAFPFHPSSSLVSDVLV